MFLVDKQAIKMRPVARAPKRKIQRQGGIADKHILISSDDEPNVGCAQNDAKGVTRDGRFPAFKGGMGGNQPV